MSDNEAFKAALDAYMRLNPSSDPSTLMQGFAAGWVSKRDFLSRSPAKKEPCTCDEGDPSCPHGEPTQNTGHYPPIVPSAMRDADEYFGKKLKVYPESAPRCSLCGGTGVMPRSHDVDKYYEEESDDAALPLMPTKTIGRIVGKFVPASPEEEVSDD